MFRLGPPSRSPDLTDEAFYALLWRGVAWRDAAASVARARCCAAGCRWTGGLALCGARVCGGSVTVTDGSRAVVVPTVKSTLSAEWVTLAPGWHVVATG